MTKNSYEEFELELRHMSGIERFEVARTDEPDERPDSDRFLATYILVISDETRAQIDKQLQESGDSKTLDGLKRTLHDKGADAIDYDEPSRLIVEVPGGRDAK